MKKIIFLSAIACSVAFYACKKDSTNTSTPDTEVKPTIDPVALNAAVKVGYGTSVAGDLPAASTAADAPTLLEAYDNRTYSAVNGRYVVIYPQVNTGTVKGYYIKINGAASYFKVDYSAAFNLRKAKKTADHAGLKGDDRTDSSIVIKLPEGLKGDTFSIKYAVYDSLNRVSNSINAFVNILVSANSTDNNLVAGTWRQNRSKSNNNDWSTDTTKYTMDSATYTFNCIDNQLQWCYSGDCGLVLPYSYSGSSANDITFGAKNTFTATYGSISRRLNINASSCSNLVYDNQDYSSSTIGGYVYNSATKILTIIYDGDGKRGDSDNEISNLHTYPVTVVSISATRLVIYEREFDLGEGVNVNQYYNEYKKM